MRWTANKPKPSYLQYARIVRAYKAYMKELKAAGPTAVKRFRREFIQENE